jgi:hypothetical protein
MASAPQQLFSELRPDYEWHCQWQQEGMACGPVDELRGGDAASIEANACAVHCDAIPDRAALQGLANRSGARRASIQIVDVAKLPVVTHGVPNDIKARATESRIQVHFTCAV